MEGWISKDVEENQLKKGGNKVNAEGGTKRK